jgi:hypothetical protein
MWKRNYQQSSLNEPKYHSLINSQQMNSLVAGVRDVQEED